VIEKALTPLLSELRLSSWSRIRAAKQQE